MSQKLPIGIQSFEKLRTEDYVYIDKTALLYNLVKKGGYYFISRPRRFGKSLLVSAAHAYSEGRKELFQGFPNKEEEEGFLNALLPFYSGISDAKIDSVMYHTPPTKDKL